MEAAMTEASIKEASIKEASSGLDLSQLLPLSPGREGDLLLLLGDDTDDGRVSGLAGRG